MVPSIRPRTDLAAALLVALAIPRIAAATGVRGEVTFAGLPVPGATVTATGGDSTRVSITDEQGIFRFADLADGPWTIEVGMLGFAPARQDVNVSPQMTPPVVVMTLLPFNDIAAGWIVGNETAPAAGHTPTQRPPRPGFERAGVKTPHAGAAAAASPPASEATVTGGDAGDRSADAADGFLVNGSVNNGAASPFAQLPAFGNNRRGARSLYNGGIGGLFGNSVWDARPFSFTSQPTPKPSYSDAQLVGSFAGPVKIPGLKNKANLFLGYQHTDNHDATTHPTLVPTAAERNGDFSRSVDALGRPVHIVDPSTGVPFADNVIPASRISPQAAALLSLYPASNVTGAAGYNFQAPVVVKTVQDALQTRLIETLNSKNQVYGSLALQRTATDSGSVFGFVDSSIVSGIDAPIAWSHRFSQFLSLRVRYQFTLLMTHTTPYFANRENVAGDAGITGNDQDPVNWGPPTLIFSTGIAGLASAQYASNRDQAHAWGGETQWMHGRHTVTTGGDFRVRHLDIDSQQNARGTFAFTGAASGSDLADFLLGIPDTSSIAFGNADKRLRGTAADAYITDDLRLSPTFTANIGLRWEFESPFTEALGRLVNLDIAPGFTATVPVLATSPDGALTGRRYPASLVRPDFRGVQPRIGIAWRPVPGSSLVIRGGYGIYRNSSVYQAVDLLLAQQPPLSTTSSVQNSAAHPLTLANGFVSPAVTANTFAVDPDLRVGYSHNWQLLIQRDLPASLTMTATYLGTKGSHLFQEFLPNTYPIGAARPCPACPAGFVYLTSNGSSSREAGQFQLRRRLRSGMSASVQYTLAKATDNAAAAFTGASLNGAAIAQDWRDLDAEWAPSNFDQRHVIAAQFQYTTGMGIAGGALATGLRGSLLKGWTVTAQCSAGSGLPLTPVYLAPVPGTGVTGTIRPDLTGASTDAPSGFYANPRAFGPPPAGHWGDAGRNSIRGPAQFSLDASLGRSFLWGPRLTFDWRIDATNVLNRVTYTGVNTIAGSPQFGLPAQANMMRKLQSSLRMRF